MEEPLENLYFNWLCAKIVYLENPTPSLTYWSLLRLLYGTEYVWLISGDDNRAEDGLMLREEFLLESGLENDVDWDNSPCSVLEMLIAFSRRAEYTTDEPASNWFWEFVGNLGLSECNDANGADPDKVGEILYTWLWREYRMSGRGGLFPINNVRSDQTQLETWYQFCEYLVDQDRMP